MNHIWDRKPG